MIPKYFSVNISQMTQEQQNQRELAWLRDFADLFFLVQAYNDDNRCRTLRVGNIAKIYKGKKFPIGTESKVVEIKETVYGKRVVLENGMDVDAKNILILDESIKPQDEYCKPEVFITRHLVYDTDKDQAYILQDHGDGKVIPEPEDKIKRFRNIIWDSYGTPNLFPTADPERL